MTAQQFAEIIQDAGFDTRSYSGRGMYGKQCLAFTCESTFAVAKVVEAAQGTDLLSEVLNAFKRAESDHMGLNTVVYFPRIEYSEQ